MEIFKQIAPVRAFIESSKKAGKTIGLVPTMGALHAGHISLIEAAKTQNSIVISTIFVNPTQFTNAGDLANYPRSLEHDVELLKKVGCDLLFCPEVEEMYPETSQLLFDFGALTDVMEGKFRPGHFSGVALVVSKLFNIVQPDNAFFGQKDWQQFAVLQKLVDELRFNLTLHSIPTLREVDGLAMSSRNLRLSTSQRAQAIQFYQALLFARHYLREGNSVEETKKVVTARFYEQPGISLEYFEVADSKNLNLLTDVKDSVKPILCIAGYVGEIRLIDNMFLD